MGHSNEGTGMPDQARDFLSDRLDINLARFRKLLGTSPDITIREWIVSAEKDLKVALVYFENLVDKKRINEDIVRPLLANANEIAAWTLRGHPNPTAFQSRLITASAIQLERTFNGAAESLLAGDTILLIDGLNEALVFNTHSWVQRKVEKPETEVSIRGPRESFVETLDTNVVLLRRRISHPDLIFEPFKVGRITCTKVYIAYLKGVVNEKIVAEIRFRLSRIDTDGILGSGYIEQFIGDAPWSPFSTMGYSERPDVVAAKILEGRAAILVDGNPEVLTVPALLIESFQSPDDYNYHPYYATLIRWIRYIAFGVSILGPAIYIALASFNIELIPTPLLITLASGNEGTPFPTFVEVIIMGLLFEIFREAGIRLPRPFGEGITFVLALIMAQAAISIGLAGVGTVAVVALTAIASLIVPGQANASILIRLAMAVLASFFGIYGILLGTLVLLAHIVSLRSFGVPYLAPVAPFNPRDFEQDVLLRTPLWSMFARPRTIGWHNPRRQASHLIPTPPEDKD